MGLLGQQKEIELTVRRYVSLTCCHRHG